MYREFANFVSVFVVRRVRADNFTRIFTRHLHFFQSAAPRNFWCFVREWKLWLLITKGSGMHASSCIKLLIQ